jgi:hypothetical protein
MKPRRFAEDIRDGAVERWLPDDLEYLSTLRKAK